LTVNGVDCLGHLDLLAILEDVPEVLTPEVTDTSDQMPMCLEDIQMLDIDDLLEPVEDEDEPDHPSYCTQNNGDCSTCSLVNYGLDCMNNRVIDREVNP
jgi:hypothetical protein